MSSMRRPAFLWKATSVDPVSLDLAEILTAGEAAIGGPLSRRLAVEGNVALRHEQEPFTVCWIAGLDHGFAEKDATLGLPDDPLDQRAIVVQLSLPWLNPRVGHRRQLCRSLIEIGQRRSGGKRFGRPPHATPPGSVRVAPVLMPSTL